MRVCESHRTTIFGVDVDNCTLAQAAQRLTGWMHSDRHCRYVVTPNLDHVVQLQQCELLRSAYAGAAMVLADGWPLVAASRIFGDPLPERVAGSDVIPAIFELACAKRRPCTVFLLGAAPGVADLAAQKIHERWPAVHVVGTHSPPPGFENDPQCLRQIFHQVAACRPDLLVAAFGAPRQELFLHQHCSKLPVGVAIAAGATIDFLAGEQRRAPGWMRKVHLEWSHRLITNPRRLSKRYAGNLLALPGLLRREQRVRRLQNSRRTSDIR